VVYNLYLEQTVKLGKKKERRPCSTIKWLIIGILAMGVCMRNQIASLPL